MADDLTIRQLGGAGELELLAPLWNALRLHHVGLGSLDLPVRDPDESWAVRRGIYERGLAAGDWLWLAETGGEGIGYAYVERGGPWASWETGLVATLTSLVVAPELRSEGIGELLLQTAKAACRAEGYTHLQVGYIEGNDRAAAFYARAGFTPIERVLAMPL